MGSLCGLGLVPSPLGDSALPSNSKNSSFLYSICTTDKMFSFYKGNIILQIGKLMFREVNDAPKVTQQLSDRAGTEAQGF